MVTGESQYFPGRHRLAVIHDHCLPVMTLLCRATIKLRVRPRTHGRRRPHGPGEVAARRVAQVAAAAAGTVAYEVRRGAGVVGHPPHEDAVGHLQRRHPQRLDQPRTGKKATALPVVRRRARVGSLGGAPPASPRGLTVTHLTGWRTTCDELNAEPHTTSGSGSSAELWGLWGRFGAEGTRPNGGRCPRVDATLPPHYFGKRRGVAGSCGTIECMKRGEVLYSPRNRTAGPMTVNRLVVGSNPTRGAEHFRLDHDSRKELTRHAARDQGCVSAFRPAICSVLTSVASSLASLGFAASARYPEADGTESARKLPKVSESRRGAVPGG